MLQKRFLAFMLSERQGQQLQESKNDYAVSRQAQNPCLSVLSEPAVTSPYVSPGTCWSLYTMTALPCACLPARYSYVATFPFCTRLVVSNSTRRMGQLRAARGFQRGYNSGKMALSQHSVPCTLAALQGNAVQPQQQKRDSPTYTPAWDVVGLGQAMVDLSATVDDDFLVRLGVVKGSRRYRQQKQTCSWLLPKWKCVVRRWF